MSSIQVNSVQQLREILSDWEQHDFFIQLNHNLRSSKSIYMVDEDTIDVFHSSSDTWEELDEDGLQEIEAAIKAGAFYWEPPGRTQLTEEG